MTDDVLPPDPTPVLDLIEAFRRSKTMFAAVSLGVFDALSAGPKSCAALAVELLADADALGRLLDGCVGLGLLERQGQHYANTPAATAYLCRTRPTRVTSYVTFANDVLWKLWADLEGAVREGSHRWRQAFGLDAQLFGYFFRTEEAKREFLLGMHGFGLLSSPAVVSAFDLGKFSRFIDLGGATGHLAEAACRRYPNLRAVIFDLPEVVPLAREVLSASPVADRITVEVGDFFNDPLPEGDLYALGRVLHDWPEAKILTLLRKIQERLPDSGALLLAEMLLDEDRSGPVAAQMQSLNMLVCTEGKERTLAEYAALLQQAGFAEIQGRRTGTPLDAVLAVKG